jgi:hypothetical protein
MTNVIHLSTLAENQASLFPPAQAVAPPTLDQLLETRELLAEGMRSLCHIQMLLEGLITTTIASDEQPALPDARLPAGPERL